MFAPRMRWETLKAIAVNIKDTAKEYEIAFNGIKSSVENNENFKQVGIKVFFCDVICGRISVFGIDSMTAFQSDIFVLQLAGKMAKVARKQVNAEKKRLIEARNIANSEKRLYVKVVF